jgi:hypothetical protein
VKNDSLSVICDRRMTEKIVTSGGVRTKKFDPAKGRRAAAKWTARNPFQKTVADHGFNPMLTEA